MGAPITRIVSDVHYGERSSTVRSFRQLAPLADGAAALVFNGDTFDSRPAKEPRITEDLRREVLGFSGSAGVPVSFITGNHDPDFSQSHSMEFADGRIFVTHGDVLFDNIVPWSQDAGVMRTRVIAALAALPDEGARRLEERLAVFRSVSASIPQRHQAEKNPVLFALRLAGDTVWPPGRFLTILKAWREAPDRAAALARGHRPKARFVVIGHTHKPGVWRTAPGVVVINTGSFSRPFGSVAADISEEGIRVRRVEARRGEFLPGPTLAEFPLS